MKTKLRSLRNESCRACSTERKKTLALLREEVKRRRGVFASPADQRHLLQEIDQRRGELQFAAISLGERIYDEKPKKFTARLSKRYRRSR